MISSQNPDKNNKNDDSGSKDEIKSVEIIKDHIHKKKFEHSPNEQTEGVNDDKNKTNKLKVEFIGDSM